MGEHRHSNQKSLPTRWIICTKWSVPIAVPVLSPKGETVGDNVPAEPTFQYFWTPIGTQQRSTKRGKRSGMPVSYATEEEAIAGLREVIKLEPELTKQNLHFVALEVKYAPNKIKVYKQVWFDKYCTKESELEFKEHKFTDTIQ